MKKDVRNKFLSLCGTAHGSRLFCLLAGAVFSLAFRWEPLFWLVFPALSFFFFVNGKRKKGRFGRAFCFFAGFLLCLCTWFTALYPLSRFGYTDFESLLIVGFCVLLFPLGQALLCAGVFQAERLLPDQPVLKSVGYGLLWVLVEWALSFGPLAFPWGTVALSQTGFTPLLQTVSVFGVYGLTFSVVTICSLCGQGVLLRKKSLAAAGAVILAAEALLGSILLLIPTPAERTVRTAMIQGCADSDDQWTTERVINVYETYTDMTREAAKQGAKLIVLPETAIAVNFYEGGKLHEDMAKIAKIYDCTIIMGVLERRDGVRNSLVAINPDGTISGTYEKQHLVPFGEFIPFESFLMKWFPSLADLNKTGTSLVTEKTPAIIAAEKYRFGCFICYDSVFPGSAQIGEETDFTVISTNDSWFKTSSGIYQHLRYAKLRAVEGRRTVLRAANTGISAVIDGHGRIVGSTEPMEKTILYAEAELGGKTTLCPYVGDLFPPFAAAFLTAFLIFYIVRRFRKKEKKEEKTE